MDIVRSKRLCTDPDELFLSCSSAQISPRAEPASKEKGKGPKQTLGRPHRPSSTPVP